MAPEGASGWELPTEQKDFFPSAEMFSIPADNGVEISCVSVPPEAALPGHLQAIPVRRILGEWCAPAQPATETGDQGLGIGRLLRAFHVAQWRPESRFCGTCGGENKDGDDGNNEFVRLCPACGRMEYPRITPAVITLITNDEGKILLAHNKKFAPGLYSLIAGYTEAGESLEAAVARETREEVNIELCDIRYVTSQPWPFPNSLMAGFSARHASGEIKPDNIEIEHAGWFSRDNLPQLPGPGSLSRLLIEKWLNNEQ